MTTATQLFFWPLATFPIFFFSCVTTWCHIHHILTSMGLKLVNTMAFGSLKMILRRFWVSAQYFVLYCSHDYIWIFDEAMFWKRHQLLIQNSWSLAHIIDGISGKSVSKKHELNHCRLWQSCIIFCWQSLWAAVKLNGNTKLTALSRTMWERIILIFCNCCVFIYPLKERKSSGISVYFWFLMWIIINHLVTF